MQIDCRCWCGGTSNGFLSTFHGTIAVELILNLGLPFELTVWSTSHLYMTRADAIPQGTYELSPRDSIPFYRAGEAGPDVGWRRGWGVEKGWEGGGCPGRVPARGAMRTRGRRTPRHKREMEDMWGETTEPKRECENVGFVQRRWGKWLKRYNHRWHLQFPALFPRLCKALARGPRKSMEIIYFESMKRFLSFFLLNELA